MSEIVDLSYPLSVEAETQSIGLLLGGISED